MASHENHVSDRIKNANVKDDFKRPKNQLKKKNHKEEFEDRIIDYVTFYRKNLHRFVEHYFGIELHFYQKLLIYMMNLCPLIVVVGCRAMSKSFVIAIYACAVCILKPNSKVVIASSTKKQSSLIVSEKIKKELMIMSPNLCREIKDIKAGSNETEVLFQNGSTIVVCPATDNARGLRATVLIYEEFRMIKKEIIDSVLSPFLIVRPTPYLKKPEYSYLQEEPTEIYISSAWFRSHWMFDLMKIATVSMYKTKDALIFGTDYAITLLHSIRTKKQLLKEKKKLDNMSFDMEYNNLMVGGAENAFYTFELLSRCQKIKKAFYPRKPIDVIENKKNKFDIPKQRGEIRIISVDIAMVTRSNGANDNTVITCIRALPVRDYYERQVCYIDAFNGGNTSEQALKIKEAFYDFEADYCVLDGQNAGISIADELGKITYSDARDIEYESWICFNDENTASRIKNKDSKPVLYIYKGNAEINHELHIYMKDALEKNRIKLLVNSTEAKDYLDTKREYINSSTLDKVNFEKCYIQTDLLINEMINLNMEINKNTNKIKLVENRNGTKDRYISLGMGNYYIKLLELDLQDSDEIDLSSRQRCISSVQF